jgi:hypothetical protein
MAKTLSGLFLACGKAVHFTLTRKEDEEQKTRHHHAKPKK